MTALLLQADNGGLDWPQAMIAVGGIAMVTIIVVVVVWQVFLSWRAKMSIAREEAYRQLAEAGGESQRSILEQQHRLSDDLASVNQRLANIERILQQVE